MSNLFDVSFDAPQDPLHDSFSNEASQSPPMIMMGDDERSGQIVLGGGSSSAAGKQVVRDDASSTATTQATIAATKVGAGPTQTRIRRRNRMITSCLECRRRKLKCDKSHPCINCTKFHRDCVFLAPALDQASQLKLTEIKEKVGSLERLLERDVAKSSTHAASNPTVPPGQDRILPDDNEDFLPPNDDEKDLYPTPMAIQDGAYGDDGDDDDLLDLGIRLGKMRINERIGGFFRPRISEELEYTIASYERRTSASEGERQSASPQSAASPLPPAAEWLKPSSAYITPSSGFFFGSDSNSTSLVDYLPSRLAADRLVKQYFDCVHPVCQILHRPSFEKEYEAFWDEVTVGVEPPASVQTVVFASMFSAAVSMDEEVITRNFGVTKTSLLENFKLGTETALSRANFLRSTKVQTLQGFVMYLIPLCRAEMSRAHAVLVGAAIRMAEISGLSRDGEAYGMSPIETHVRRLIWHQICFLDIRTCEAQGPRPTIRHDEFDTKLPINANDTEFHTTGAAPVPTDRFTDVTLSLIRFEVNEMVRTIWVDRPRVESRKISITAALTKIETFRTKMAAKYDHLMDDRVPVQRAAKVIKGMLVSRLHVMLLSRYHVSVTSPMPDRLRRIMLTSGITLMEMAIHFETDPDLKPWAWYSGAFHQYHTAFLLLMEVFTHKNRSGFADRIWSSLDYVFECDPSLAQEVKAVKILSEIQQKTAIYQSMRGMRAPTQMDRHLGTRARKVADPSQREENLKYITSPNATLGTMTGRSSNASSPPAASETTKFVGRAPIPEVQFAGISDGQALWALPSQAVPDRGYESPSSTASSQTFGGVVGDGRGVGVQMSSSIPIGAPQQQDLMADIDWVAFDALFPPNQGDIISMVGFQSDGASVQQTGSYF